MTVACRDFYDATIGIQSIGYGEWKIGNHQFMMNATIENDRAYIRIVGHWNVYTLACTLRNIDVMIIDHLLRQSCDVF